MLKSVFFFATIIAILNGCGIKKDTDRKAKNDGNSFFPVTKYLLGQVKELDSLPVTPLKITTINNRKDSEWIKREGIRLFVQPFVTPVIDSVTLYKYFAEKSFLDQTINAFTFSYDPTGLLPASLQIKRWDVYIDPHTNKVSRIYIVKQSNNDTILKTIQLTWKSGYYCQVTTITEKKEEAPKIKEEKLIWNFDE